MTVPHTPRTPFIETPLLWWPQDPGVPVFEGLDTAPTVGDTQRALNFICNELNQAVKIMFQAAVNFGVGASGHRFLMPNLYPYGQGHAKIVAATDPPIYEAMEFQSLTYYQTTGATHEFTEDVQVQAPCYGHLTQLQVNAVEFAQLGAHDAGVMDFVPYNATTGGACPQVNAPEVLNVDTSPAVECGQTLSDGLAVNFNDEVSLWTRGAFAGHVRVLAFYQMVFEEDFYVVGGGGRWAGVSPEGVYGRCGQFGGQPAFQRVDGAFWLYRAVGSWLISAVLGAVGAGYWVYPAAPAGPVGAYTATGDATGAVAITAWRGGAYVA